MAITTVIFDMDELMIDSSKLHREITVQMLRKRGIKVEGPEDILPRDELLQIFGLKMTDIWTKLKSRYNLTDSVDELHREFNNILIPMFKQDVPAMPGVQELVKLLKKEGYKLVIASSSMHIKIDIVLNKLELVGMFDEVVSGEDDILHGKPAPDTFLAAAKKIEVTPEECIVLEDAQNGVKAAKAAGMKCIGVHNQYVFERIGVKQDLSLADIQVESLQEINLDMIKSLEKAL
ncbi:MAG: HAD family phosphatase [Nanoarchaeota archaeon]|nr:HAD family phosphatase [Nanoarchaeota archaeon]